MVLYAFKFLDDRREGRRLQKQKLVILYCKRTGWVKEFQKSAIEQMVRLKAITSSK
jgi:hypothetical protein